VVFVDVIYYIYIISRKFALPSLLFKDFPATKLVNLYGYLFPSI